MRLIYFVFKANRRRQFQVETKVLLKSGSKFIEKRALTYRSTNHLSKMLETYTALSKLNNLNKIVKIVAPKRTSSGSIQFKYIQGISAERFVLEKILSGEIDGASQAIDKIFTLIDTLPAIRINPTKSDSYITVFGKNFNKTQDCVSIGVIDLNFDNIIIDEKNFWHLYDYEWTFNFPVAKHHLKTRVLWFLLARHREILRFYAQSIESVKIYESLYVPVELYNRYRNLLSNLNDFAGAEASFQFYTSGKPDSALGLIENGLNEKPVIKEVAGFDAMLNKKVSVAVQELKKELNEERRRSIRLQNKIDAISSSRSYNLAVKLSAAKKKIKRAK